MPFSADVQVAKAGDRKQTERSKRKQRDADESPLRGNVSKREPGPRGEDRKQQQRVFAIQRPQTQDQSDPEPPGAARGFTFVRRLISLQPSDEKDQQGEK